MRTTKLRQRTTGPLALIALTILVAPSVKAQCLAAAHSSGMFAPGLGSLQDSVGLDQGSSDQAGSPDTILGLWKKLEFSGGVVSDIGFQQFNAGGTELVNDTGPSGGGNNFCMGAWKRIEPRTYAGVHPFFLYDTSGKAVAIAIEKARYVVAPDGNTFSGTWTQDNYDFFGNVIPGTHFEGQLTGTRIAPGLPFPFPFPFQP